MQRTIARDTDVRAKPSAGADLEVVLLYQDFATGIRAQGEFQRLGNPKTHKVNVRVIAATNRELAEEVRRGRFREDLYYRLKVFPIEVPPLRERVQDIPALVFAFMDEFSTRTGKKITKMPRIAMEKLERYSWPGNIRELRNVIEHSVIISTGDVLKLSVLSSDTARSEKPISLAEVERKHIIKTLEATGWRIKGEHGAAHRLGLEPSTLYSRMQKLEIPNRRQKDELSNGAVSAPAAGANGFQPDSSTKGLLRGPHL